MEKNKHMIEGIHYATGEAIRLEIENGVIVGLENSGGKKTGDKVQDALPLIAPGLVDLQVNGYKGTDFNDARLKKEGIEAVSKALLQVGVTSYFPTLITGDIEKTSVALKTIHKAFGSKGLAASMIGGIHLEGPFISPERGPRGAHPKAHCIKPDLALVKRYQKDAGGLIRIITLAPELPGSASLIRGCLELGMVVAIGHTAASGDEIRMAVDAGATLSTHLGNGCHRVLPRHPNYIWDQLAEDRLYASMIADGFHLPDQVLKVFKRSKGDKAILVSDSMPYAGLKAGVYDSPATGKVILTDEGKLHVEGKPDTLAGSAATLLDGVRKMAGLENLAISWDMGSLLPAKLMNLPVRKGLSVGAPADFVLLENTPGSIRIRQLCKGGLFHDLKS